MCFSSVSPNWANGRQAAECVIGNRTTVEDEIDQLVTHWGIQRSIAEVIYRLTTAICKGIKSIGEFTLVWCCWFGTQLPRDAPKI